MMLAHRNLFSIPIEHDLATHSRMVAQLCAVFSAEIHFDYSNVGYLLGLLHDFGKLQPEFQKYLLTVTSNPPQEARQVPHAAIGAYYIGNTSLTEKLKKVCQYIISGHHRGLYNYIELRIALSRKNTNNIKSCNPSREFEDQVLEVVNSINSELLFSALHTRMLFSALVDADFLDTENFMNNDQSVRRRECVQVTNLALLESKLNGFVQGFSREGDVNKARNQFLCQAIESGNKAEHGTIYSLNLPTGAGKTITSMAWALRCANRFEHRRIIYVIPYTSIITQTAEVFRKIFGDEVVLEHHSDIEIDEEGERYTRVKLLSENWDVPIVVTTNVQFFESLFSHKVSKCRKLHNICNSVIVFDEVQMFPMQFLNPILRCIDQLNQDFKCSILLSSATQPPFDQGMKQKFSLKEGIYALRSPIKAVIPYDEKAFGCFEGRVDWQLNKIEVSIKELAMRLAEYDQVLCVVNSRRDAALVFEEVKRRTCEDMAVFHLSRMMCSAHLSDKLDEVKRYLREGRRLIVISTQLIEAGVDLDFPVVYRAFAGIDSIVQAGGRCNREGKDAEKGKLFVFNLKDGSKNANGIKKAQYATGDALLEFGQVPQMPTSELISLFYEKFYNQHGSGDEKKISNLLWNEEEEWDFEDASERFKLIDNNGIFDAYVKYGTEGTRLIEEVLKTKRLDRLGRRRLQRYRVGLRKIDFDTLLEGGMLQRIELWEDPNQALYIQNDEKMYTDEAGVCSDNHWLTDTLIT